MASTISHSSAGHRLATRSTAHSCSAIHQHAGVAPVISSCQRHAASTCSPCASTQNLRISPVLCRAARRFSFKPFVTVEQLQQPRQTSCQCISEASALTTDGNGTEYVVVNFYHLVDVPNPQQLVEDHKKWVAEQGIDIRGRIYYSAQGVNAQYGGTKEDALKYLDWLKSQPLWQGIRHSVWPSPMGHAFPKLRLKYKPNLISLAGGIAGLPVTQPEARATPLEPSQWKQMLAQAQERKVVVLDVRNDYEWDAGHFQGAGRPDEEVFAETPVGQGQEDVPAPLRGQPSDTPVMMYCTGGIRCDIYSTFLKSKGFNNLYTLEGGIQNYLKQEGPELWKGSLYVFDGRMAISGDQRDPEAAVDSESLPAAVPCQVCNTADAELPHVNCANIDCNELFIACAACKTRLRGCCCETCMEAPRLLRPAKLDGGNYGAWGNYADGDHVGSVMATARGPREGRVARRARRREALKEKRQKQMEEQRALKQRMREAMARLEAQEQQQQQQQQEQNAQASSKTLVASAI